MSLSLIFLQNLMISIRILGAPDIYYRVCKISTQDNVLSLIIPVDNPTFYFFTIYFNIIPSLKPSFQKSSSPWGFPTKMYVVLMFCMRATYPAQFIIFDLIILIICCGTCEHCSEYSISIRTENYLTSWATVSLKKWLCFMHLVSDPIHFEGYKLYSSLLFDTLRWPPFFPFSLRKARLLISNLKCQSK